MDGGEARPLTAMPKGASAPVWSPDGRFIAFTSSTKEQDFEKKKDGSDEEPSDVRVITKAVYRDVYKRQSLALDTRSILGVVSHSASLPPELFDKTNI